jgi:hypothetical protein
MSRPTLTVKIGGQDIPDFYYMVRWFTKNKGNTFCYLWKELKKMYPEIAQSYGDTPED